MIIDDHIDNYVDGYIDDDIDEYIDEYMDDCIESFLDDCRQFTYSKRRFHGSACWRVGITEWPRNDPAPISICILTSRSGSYESPTYRLNISQHVD